MRALGRRHDPFGMEGLVCGHQGAAVLSWASGHAVRDNRAVILRCTRKLLDVIRPGQLADAPADGDDWYANLLRIDGRKCLLLTHAGTLFTIFEPGVRAAGLRDTGRLVTRLITRELEREGLPAGTFGDPDPASVIVAKTASRIVLGCMNDMAFMCEHEAGRAGGLARLDAGDLNHGLRRNILSARDYQRPIDLTIQRAEASP
jgi:hypothetical protein